MAGKKFILLFGLIICITINELYSAAAEIGGWRHTDLIYCSAEGGDSIFGISPQNKEFFIDGESYYTAPALVRTVNGNAIFYPNLLSVGTHTIKYGDIGTNDVTVIVTIVNQPVVTMSPLANVCSNVAGYSLFNSDSSNVSPKNGQFSGPGVDASGFFNPTSAGPGIHSITYTARVGGCSSSASRNITVVAAPLVGISAFSPVCEGSPLLQLTQGSPAGGTYSGLGVNASGIFDQSVTGIGSFPITYSYSNGTCSNSAIRNIVVASNPAADFSGLGNQYCVDHPGDALTGIPAGVTSIFTGPGVTDNGNGDGFFDPALAGLGLHQVKYIYTSVDGCRDTATRNVQVGTNVIISGLEANYCVNSANVTISGAPAAGTYTAIPGLTDNGNGIAIFNSSVAGTGIHTITYTYNDANGCINFRSETVRVYALPVPAIQNLNASYCANMPPLIIRGNYAPSGTFSGAAITDNGDGTALFSPSGLLPNGSYPITYTYQDATSSCQASVTNQVFINPLPVAVMSGNADICYGNSSDIDVTLSGSGPFTITYTDGTGSYTKNNATAPLYTIEVFPADTTGYFLTQVTDNKGCSLPGSGSALINVLPEVGITQQPLSKKVCAGSNIQFQVNAKGVDLQYQWRKDGIPIAGETNALLVIIDVQPAHIGSYNCIVTGDCGAPITSNDALLELWLPTQIITDPASIHECEGENVNLFVNATGSNITYHWYENNNPLSDTLNLTGSLTNNLLINGLTVENTGNYYVMVTGICGQQKSNTASLIVDKNAVIVSNPQDATICENFNAVFVVEVTGDNLSYQWQYNGTNIPGETAATLLIPDVTNADEGFYRCIIRNFCGVIFTSNAAELIVTAEPSILANPVSNLRCEGDNVVFNLLASGSSLSYQWRKNGTDVSDDIRILGSKSPSLTINNINSSDIAAYSCSVSNSCDTIISSSALLSVDTALAIIGQPTDIQSCIGRNEFFSITATGNNLAYQWLKNNVVLAGETNPDLIISAITSTDEAEYFCIVSNLCGKSIKSNAVNLVIKESAVIISSPTDVTVCEGDNAFFQVQAAGDGLTYQWDHNGVPLNDGGNVSGSKNNVLLITNAIQINQGVYNCFVQGDCGSERTDPSNLIVNKIPIIIEQPAGSIVCEGLTTEFKVDAQNVNQYQWQKDGVNLMGTNNATLIVNNVTLNDSGIYRCILFSSCDTLVTDGALLTVKRQPAINVEPVSAIICEGQLFDAHTEVTGSDITFQWYKDGSTLTEGNGFSGTETNTLIKNTAVIADEGIYHAEIKGYCRTIFTQPIQLEITVLPVIFDHPEAAQVCEGNSVSFTTIVNGNATYQWQKDNVDLPGKTTATLNITNAVIADGGIYRCRIGGGCSNIYTDGVLLNVNSNVIISQQPDNQVVCTGNTTNLGLTALGTNLTYQWKHGGIELTDDSRISGSEAPGLSIKQINSNDMGLYTCDVTGTCGDITSNAALITVLDQIVITKQPESVITCNGLSASFEIEAGGSNLQYQWQKDELDIAGATQSNFVINTVSAVDSGVYRCVITGACGQVFSEAAMLTVDFLPSVTLQPPASLEICTGDILHAQITATGSHLNYQWYFNGNALVNTDTISGTNKAVLHIDPLSEAHEGTYYCRIDNSCPASATSSAGMQVWVNNPPVITEQPSNINTCTGENVELRITAEGDNLTYQWKKGNIDIAGANNPVLQLNNITTTDSGTYQCIATTLCGITYSDAVRVNIAEPFTVTSNPPAFLAQCEGTMLALSVTVSGEVLTYQWKKSGIPLVNNARISGSQSPNLQISGIIPGDEGLYVCEITGKCNEVVTPFSDLTVQLKPEIVFQPGDYSVLAGGNASFNVTASGAGLSYQWYFNTAPIAGATLNEVILNTITPAHEGNYHVIVYGTCGQATSSIAHLNILSSSVISQQPVGTVKCEGESAVLSVGTIGSGHTYQWKKNGIVLAGSPDISGTEEATLSIANLKASDAGSYQCLIDGVENTIPVVVNVNRTTIILDVYGGGDFCNDETITLVADVTGDSLNYAWYKNNNPVANNLITSGSLTPILVLDPASPLHNGSYTIRVSGVCGNAISDAQEVSVDVPLSFLAQPSDSLICMGQPVQFEVSTSGNVIGWKWYKNGIPLADNTKTSGTGSPLLLINNADKTDEGDYHCIIAGVCDTLYSVSARLTVNPLVAITAQPQASVKCVGDQVTFVTSVNTTGVSFQWRKNGTINLVDNMDISGSNTGVLQITNIQNTDQGTYECIITGNCNSIISNPVNLQVNDKTIILTQPADKIICEGQSHTFSIIAGGSNLSYQWTKGGILLSDDGHYSGTATTDLYIVSATSDENGVYQCKVSGDCFLPVLTNPVRLTVNLATTVLSDIANKDLCTGSNFSLDANATGTINSYQWEKDGILLMDDGNISGSTLPVLQVINATAAHSGIYRCLVDGMCNDHQSESVEIRVITAPFITNQPLGDTVCEGNNISLNSNATGSNIEYIWKLNGDTVKNNGTITGATTADLYIQNITTSSAGLFQCTASNVCGDMSSETANIIVNSHGTIITQPVSQQKCIGDQANFFVNATGNNLLYHWELGGIPLTDGPGMSGTTTRSLILTNIDLFDNGVYRCVITDGCGTIINSDGVSLTVLEPVVITSLPTGDTLCAGQSINLAVAATGDILSWQWYKNGIPISDTPEITGTNMPSLNLNTLTGAVSGYYSVKITGSCGDAVITQSIPVLVTQPVQVIDEPDNLTRCAGQSAVLSVTATGDSLKYQWVKDGVVLTDNPNINGSKTSLLILSDLSVSDRGSYHCVISGTCGPLNSQPAVVTINEFPAAAGSITGETVVCQGTTGQIYITPAISGADYYQWNLPPGMIITSGENTRQIEVTFVQNEHGGPVSVTGVNGCGSGASSPMINVVANPLPTAYAGESTGICTSSWLLNAYAPDAPASGIWSVINGPSVITQPSLPVTAVNGLRNGVNKFIWTVTLNGCQSADTVTIYNNQLVVEAGKDTSICDHIFNLNATAPPTGIGQWSIITGAGYNISRHDPHSLVSGLSNGLNIFKWAVNNNGCVSYDTVLITNNLPSEAEAGADQYLQSDNTNLNAGNPVIGTGSWSLLNGSGTLNNAAVYNTLVTGLGQGKNIFEWMVTHNGCTSTDTVVIDNSLTDTTDAGLNQIICSSVVRLSAKNPYPGYGEWSVKRGSATFANNNLYNTYAYNLSPGENVLIWTAYLNGFTSDSVFIINDLPTTANAGVNFSVCDDSIKLNANVPYIGTGIWSIVSGSGDFEQINSPVTTVNNLARGNNNFKWTITNGTCTSSSVVTFTNNKPTTAEAGYDAVTCEDTLVLNPNTPTFGTGEWSVSSGSAKFNGNIAYDLGIDDNELVYTIRNSGCYSRDTLVVTSHKPTTSNLGPDVSVCLDSLTITANVPIAGSGLWSLQSGTADIEDIYSASSKARNIGPGENILRWTISYLECNSYDDIMISNDFVKADAGEDLILCSDRTVLEANDPGYSLGNWTIIGGATGANIANPTAPNSTVSNLAQGTNILRWTISKNSCKSYDEVTITNNNPTPAFAGEDAYLCVNEVQLRANPVTKGIGTWTILSGSGILADLHNPSSVIRNLGSGTNVLRWTSENAGCSATDEVIISNNQPLNVYSGLDQTLCADSTVLYANPPALGTGIWSVIRGSASFFDPLQYNSGVFQLGYGTNILKWTVATTGCSVTDTVFITNNLPSVAIAGSDFPVCNSSGTLSANTPLYGTGEWSLISGAGNIENAASPRTMINDLALGNNLILWTITNGNCISSDALMITNNSPTIAEAGENAEVCGESAILYANFPIVGNGYWTVMSGAGDFVDSLNFNTIINGLHFGNNTLRWTTQNGSCSTIDEITITNNLAYVYAGEDQIVYEAGTILSGNNPGMGAGEWLLSAGSGIVQSPGSFSTTISALGAGLNTFEWTVTNGACTARDQVVIHYKVMPRVGFNVSDDNGCPGLTVDFVNTTQYGTTYKWEMGDGSVSSDVNPRHTYEYADNYIVRLTAFGPDNQLVTKDTLITIHVKPVANFQFAPDTAFVNKPLRCYDGSYGDIAMHSWNFGDGDLSNEENPMHYYRESGSFNISLVVTSAFGCTDNITHTVIVADDGLVIFPNAFTPDINGPNGGAYNETDRSNDVFHPYHENVAEFHMEIYSRWGVLLFETDDINIGWDGYYKNELLAKDVYVWKATGKFVSGSEFLKTGNVLLIK